MNLLELKKKKQKLDLRVVGFEGPESLLKRLSEIGFHKGSILKIMGQAPMGGPLLIQLNSTVLALRDQECECLQVQTL